MTQPTGVFVRLPLCEERAITFHKESSHAWDEFNGSSNALACEAGLLAIGTPVAGGELEVVDYSEYEPEYHSEGMGCGLEDRGIHDRYEAMGYGWDQALDRVCSEFPEAVLLSDAQASLAAAQAEIVRKDDEIDRLWEALESIESSIDALPDDMEDYSKMSAREMRRQALEVVKEEVKALKGSAA